MDLSVVCLVPGPHGRRKTSFSSQAAWVWGQPYRHYLGLDGGVGGELTYHNGTSPHTWAQTCIPSPYKYPISPYLCTVWNREIWVSVEFTKINANKRWFEQIGAIPTKYQSLRQDFDSKSPSICPRYARWGIPFDGCITPRPRPQETKRWYINHALPE